MPSKIIIHGGTRSTTETSLCESCANATVVQGMATKDKLVKCGDLGRLVDFNVETCNSYRRFGELTLYDMKEMATIVDIKAGTVGFYSAKKWKEKRGSDEILPKEYGDGYPI